jgi:Mg2+ and Co2+ transporter CorA
VSPHAGRAQLVESSGVDSDIDAKFVKQLLKSGSFFWLDLDGVPPHRVDEFCEAMDLNSEARQHLADKEQRSSFAESNIGVRWASFAMRDANRLSQVRGVYTRSFLLTVHDHPCRGLSDARHRYERMVESDQDDGPLVFFMVLDALASTFESVLARLDYRLDELEAAVLGGPPIAGYLQQVFEVRQILTPILRALGPYRRDLVSILGDIDRLPGMQAGTQRYLESHRSHVMALFDSASECRGETRDAMEAYSMTSTERQGEVINWLTIVAAVFLPLSFVTGYFGMNFSFVEHLHGTATIVLLAVALPCVLATTTVLLLRFLVRRQGIHLIPPLNSKNVPVVASTEDFIDEPFTDPHFD